MSAAGTRRTISLTISLLLLVLVTSRLTLSSSASRISTDIELAASPITSGYLADGYNAAGFNTNVLRLNPSDNPVSVDIALPSSTEISTEISNPTDTPYDTSTPTHTITSTPPPITLAFLATSPLISEPPRIDPQDPHRFVIGGSGWYLIGYYPSIAALTADQTDYENYYINFIDKLSENRLNYFRNVFTMGQPYGDSMVPYQRTGPGIASDGRPKFNLDSFNQEYFDYWRRAIQYAQSKGVVVQLTIFDSWHSKAWIVEDNGDDQHSWGMKHDFYQGINNINGIDTNDASEWHDPSHEVFPYQQALIRKVVDSVGDLPNIIYEISNENYSNPTWERQLADYLSEYELSKGFDPHLVMPRDLPNHDSAGGKSNDPTNTHNELVSNYSIDQPLIADNDGGGHVNADVRRTKGWAALTAGGHINYFHWAMYDESVLNSEDVADGMRYLGLLGQFLEDFEIDLRGMAPFDNLVSRGWCYAKRGERYVIYLNNGGSTTVSDLPANYSAIWFNPQLGTNQLASGGPDFVAPDSNDWVLFINNIATGQTPTATSIPTSTLTQTIVPTPMATSTLTFTPAATNTMIPTVVPTATNQPTNTTTHTAAPTSTITQSPTVTLTPTVTYTPTNTLTPTKTLTPTETYTPTITLTPTDTLPPTNTPSPTNTPFPPTETLTPVNTLTSMDTPTIMKTLNVSETPQSTSTVNPASPVVMSYVPSVEMSVNKQSAKIGEGVAFTLVVANNSDQSVQEILVTNPILSFFNIDNLETTKGIAEIDPGSNSVTVVMDALEKGEVAEITIVVVVNETANFTGEVSNTAYMRYEIDGIMYIVSSNKINLLIEAEPARCINGLDSPISFGNLGFGLPGILTCGYGIWVRIRKKQDGLWYIAAGLILLLIPMIYYVFDHAIQPTQASHVYIDFSGCR